MVIQRESQPQIVTLERPRHHYILLFAANGSMLGLKENGDLALFDDADDRVISVSYTHLTLPTNREV